MFRKIDTGMNKKAARQNEKVGKGSIEKGFDSSSDFAREGSDFPLFIAKHFRSGRTGSVEGLLSEGLKRGNLLQILLQQQTISTKHQASSHLIPCGRWSSRGGRRDWRVASDHKSNLEARATVCFFPWLIAHDQ